MVERWDKQKEKGENWKKAKTAWAPSNKNEDRGDG